MAYSRHYERATLEIFEKMQKSKPFPCNDGQFCLLENQNIDYSPSIGTKEQVHCWV
jgi:hypothetical protein